MKWIFDTECYRNFFCFVAKSVDSGKVVSFNSEGGFDKIIAFLKTPDLTLIGYNNIDYDNHLLEMILDELLDVTPTFLKDVSDRIIEHKEDLRPNYNMGFKSIDLSYYYPKIEGKKGGKEEETDKKKTKKYIRLYVALKELGARIDFQTIQDLPIEPDKILTNEEKEITQRYCLNDVLITEKAYRIAEEEIKLRVELERQTGGRCHLINRTRAQVAENFLLQKYAEASRVPAKKIKEILRPIKPFKIDILEKLNITYEQPDFQSWFDRIKKVHIGFNDKTRRPDYSALKQVIRSKNGLDLSLGAGGVHGAKPGIYESTDAQSIIDIDVTSYYLAIIINNVLFPDHLTKEWTEVIKRVRDERVAAKKAGQKLVADALKTVALACFGKMGSSWSWMYSPRMVSAVTVSGEALILKIVDKLETAGIEVIYANTDGITALVKTDQEATFREIYKKWEQETGFELEESKFKKLILKDVSSYIAQKQSGALKAKGDFAAATDAGVDKAGKQGNMPIVGDAVINHYFKNTYIEETVKSCKDISRFKLLFIANKGYKLYFNEVQQQKTIRYYASKKGGRLEKRKDGSVQKLEGGDSASLLLSIPESFPTDIDYDWYIQKVNDLITKIGEETAGGLVELPNATTKTLSDKTREKNRKKAISLLLSLNKTYCLFRGYFEKGSEHPVAVPKIYGKPWVWYRNGETWYYKKGNKVFCGLDFTKVSYLVMNPFLPESEDKGAGNVAEIEGTAIEYDNLPLDEQITRLKKTPHTVLCWSGNKSIHALTRFTRPMTETEAVELNSLMPQVFGESDHSVWRKGQFVRFPGGTNYITEKEQKILSVKEQIDPEDYLRWLRDQPKSYEATTEVKTEGQHRKIVENPAKFEEKRKLIDPQIAGKLKPQDWKINESGACLFGVKYLGECPHKDRHTSQSNPTEFALLLFPNGRVFGKCMHDSCRGTATRDFLETLKIDLPVDPPGAIEEDDECWEIEQEITQVDADVSEALDGWEGAVMVIAPPGAGKTLASVQKEVEAVAENVPYTYVANNTTDLENAGKMLKTLSDEEISKRVLCLRSGKATIDEEVTEIEAGKSIEEGTKWINTHKTYLERKGVGRIFYSYLSWIMKARPFVVIDEINEYIEGLEKFIPVELMSQLVTRNGSREAQLKVYPDCPGFITKSFRCGKCRPCFNLAFDIDGFGNAVIRLKGGYVSDLKEVYFKVNVAKTISLPEVNFDVHLLQQHGGYLDTKIDYPHHFDEGEIFKDEADIQDAIECSLDPAIVEPYPTYKKERFYPVMAEELPKDERGYVVEPSRTCGKYLLLRDMAGLSLIARYARGVRFLCTEENPKTTYILKKLFPDLKIIRCKREIKKLEGVTVIGFEKELKIKTLTESLIDYNVLEFEPNERTLGTRFKKIPAGIPAAKYENGCTKFDGKVFKGGYKHLLTNSFGALGKAVSLPDFQICVVNSALYKPFIACTQTSSKQEVLAEIERYRFELCRQNLGRILRGDGRKVLIIYNLTKLDFEKLVARLDLPASSEVNYSKYIKQDDGLLYKTAAQYIDEGTFNVEEEKITQNKLSKKQRSLNKDEIAKTAEEKKEDKISSVMEDIKNHPNDTWSAIYIRNNVARLKVSERQKLKSFHAKQNKVIT